MIREIHRGDILMMSDSGQAQLVEVTSENQYREEHLPKAISIPLSELSPEKARELDIDKPVIVYCFNYQ